MSLNSPSTEGAPSIRIPRLKVRNRGPDDCDQSQTHRTQPSTSGTITTVSDGSIGTTVHSPQASIGQTSPTSPGFPIRIPKLAVRSRPSDDGDVQNAFRFPAPQSAEDPDAIRPVHCTTPPGTSYSLAPVTSHTSNFSEASALTRGNLAQNDQTSSGASKRKRMNGILGFLTLKEPSATALEQFADQQRKQAELKGIRGNNAGLSGVSDRKLPAGVPKVNSKWDGLPDWAREAAKEAKKEKKTSDPLLTKMAQSRRPASTSGSVSTFDSGSSRGPPNSLTSSTKVHLDSKGKPGRPASQKSSNSKDSSTWIRNPSKVRSSSSKRQTPTGLKPTSMPTGNVPEVPEIPSYFPEQPLSHPAAPGQSTGAISAPPSLPPAASLVRPSLGVGSYSHTHSRSISDPRLNVGMDNVAPLTSFGAEPLPSTPPEVSAPAPAMDTSPPIPRKSSRRTHSSQPSASSIAQELDLARIVSAPPAAFYDAAEPSPGLSTPGDELDINAFPLPPSSPKSSTSSSISPSKAIALSHDSANHSVTSTIPIDSSISSVACGEITSAYPQRDPNTPRRKASATFSLTPKISNPALAGTSPGRAGSPLGFAHARSNSISAVLSPADSAYAPAPTGPGSSHVRSPSGMAYVKKPATVAPWETQDEGPGSSIALTRPEMKDGAIMADSPSSPPAADKKKGKLSSFGWGRAK